MKVKYNQKDMMMIIITSYMKNYCTDRSLKQNIIVPHAIFMPIY